MSHGAHESHSHSRMQFDNLRNNNEIHSQLEKQHIVHMNIIVDHYSFIHRINYSLYQFSWSQTNMSSRIYSIYCEKIRINQISSLLSSLSLLIAIM